MLKKTTLLLSVALPFSFSQAFAMLIEDVFPQAFKQSAGIKMNSATIGGTEGYKIEEFQGEAKNRNHFDDRGGAQVQFLVMHYTVSNFPSTLNLFTKDISDGRVSAHYVLTQKDDDHGIKGGIPIQVVPEEKRSWHAGVSNWRGVKNLNATSIGIENINQGFVGNESTQPTWFPFDPDQIVTLGQLSQKIIQRHNILPQNVIGHADIAPTRKQDPGILFPWGELYTRYGVGAWLPENERNPFFISTQYLPKEKLPQGTSDAFFLSCLRKYGCDFTESATITPELSPFVKAFKSHFSHNQHPEAYNAILDEKAMLWAWGLEAKYSQK